MDHSCVVAGICYHCAKALSKAAAAATVKTCVHCFHQSFIFSPNDSPSKTMKNAFCFI